MKLETEYRIRWRQPTTSHHRTRYYSRRHHALRAAEKYRAKGCVVELDERQVVTYTDWRPSSDEVEPASQAPVRAKPDVCRHCATAITQPSGYTIWSTGGKRGHICSASGTGHFPR